MNSTDIIPALPPPPGVTSNFVNPAFNGNQIVIVGIIFPILMLPFLGARLYAKYSLIKKFHCDDYMIILAVPFTLWFCILQIIDTRIAGSGYHMWDIPLSNFENYMFYGIFGSLTYGLGTLFIKASILLFYLRLPSVRSLKLVTCMVLFVACGYCLFGAFTWLVMCRPVHKYWDFAVKGTCGNFKIAFFVGGTMNVVTDVIMLLLPLWVLRPLRLPRKQKIGVTLILMTGSFVCVVSAVRLGLIPGTLVNPDFTWVGSSVYVWCIIEMNIGIICASLPSLKTIAKHHYSGSFNEDPVFSTGDPQIPQQQYVQWPTTSTQTQDSGQSGSGNSVHLTTLSTNASMRTDDYGKDIISSISVEVPSMQPPEKAMVTGTNWPKDSR